MEEEEAWEYPSNAEPYCVQPSGQTLGGTQKLRRRRAKSEGP